ncbi:MAG: polysaccharide deacetylase family protein [Bacteroidota bacterium]
MGSAFIISLDFELHWGGFEKWSLEAYKNYFNSTRELIPQLLKAFEQTDTHATWATVGLLLNKSNSELNDNTPEEIPGYINNHLSAYDFIEAKGIGIDEVNDPYHYAPSIAAQILNTKGQELGSHSYAHFYCNEPGQTPSQFYYDAKSWNKAASKFGISARSLVFPRNQFNNKYLNECEKAGIKIVRTNPKDWWWQINSTENESFWKRLNRGSDAYLSLGGKTTFDLKEVKKKGGVYLLPASRLFRPYNPKELFLNNWKIKRIKSEMTIAAKNNECYHLWWHPHNFARHPEQNLKDLSEILNHFTELKSEYDFQSLNMNEVALFLDNGKGS